MTAQQFETLGGEPCAADWQAIQNLCDMYGMELRENKYNRMGSAGYTAILDNHAAHVPYDYTLPQIVEWLKEFYESHRR